MADVTEFEALKASVRGARGAADALGGRIGRAKRRELVFQIDQLAIEAVIILIGNSGLREHVVGVIVAANLVS